LAIWELKYPSYNLGMSLPPSNNGINAWQHDSNKRSRHSCCRGSRRVMELCELYYQSLLCLLLASHDGGICDEGVGIHRLQTREERERRRSADVTVMHDPTTQPDPYCG
jgi:hypothetical protein